MWISSFVKHQMSEPVISYVYLILNLLIGIFIIERKMWTEPNATTITRYAVLCANASSWNLENIEILVDEIQSCIVIIKYIGPSSCCSCFLRLQKNMTRSGSSCRRKYWKKDKLKCAQTNSAQELKFFLPPVSRLDEKREQKTKSENTTQSSSAKYRLSPDVMKGSYDNGTGLPVEMKYQMKKTY